MVLNSLRIKKAYGCAGIIKRLTIEITNDCQFKCPYCIKGIPNVKRISHIKPEYIDKFFDICRKYDIYNENDLRIYITGGEPTISPYFLDIIELCASCDFVRDINILTNGYNTDEIYIKANNICRRYNKMFVNNMTFHFNKLTNLDNYIHKAQYLINNGVILLLSIIIDIDYVSIDDILNIEQYLKYNFIREVYSVFNKAIPDKFEFIHKFNAQKDISDYRKIKIIIADKNEMIVSDSDIKKMKTNPFRNMYCSGFKENITINEYCYIYSSCSFNIKYKCYIEPQVKKFFDNIRSTKQVCKSNICCYPTPIRYI
jgi:MoaA/NifB/PqqE/SkfB family radical SAM enzyme